MYTVHTVVFQKVPVRLQAMPTMKKSSPLPQQLSSYGVSQAISQQISSLNTNSIVTSWKATLKHFWSWLYLTNTAKMPWRYREVSFGVIVFWLETLLYMISNINHYHRGLWHVLEKFSTSHICTSSQSWIEIIAITRNYGNVLFQIVMDED